VLSVLVDDVLPSALFERLSGRFLRGNVEPFFRQSLWFAIDTLPRFAVEQALGILAGYLPRDVAVGGAEWFVRAGRSSKGMAWHCDVDGDTELPHRHPVVSSLLYLSAVGGPTLIVDQTNCAPGGMSLPAEAPEGLAYVPAPNRFGVFAGDRLHAVGAVDGDERLRVTVGINWWRERSEAKRAIDPPYLSPDFDELGLVEDLHASSPARATAPISLDAAALAALRHRGLFPIWAQ
jgi:hypothetical protein